MPHISAVRLQRIGLAAFCVVVVALYVYGVFSARFIPAGIEGVALPLDLMVGIPAGFWFFVVRPRKLTLLAVIPVIWIGYGVSVLALGSPEAGILPYLLAALIPLELAIAVGECRKLVMVLRGAKADSADPMVWFREAMTYLVRKDIPANLAAVELSVWYYALFTWRKKPYVKSGERMFAYHNASGYMNMMLGLALVFPIEIIAVHLLISRWSVLAAIIVTALSVYAAIWLLGDARARIMRPVVVSEGAVRLECGIQMEAVIPRSDIAGTTFAKPDFDDVINYGTLYQANVWVITKRPVEIRTLTGKKHVRAIGLSLDDSYGFVEMLCGYQAEALSDTLTTQVPRESSL